MSVAAPRICAVVPSYDNPVTVRGVVERIRAHGLPVILVDDGSAEPGRSACQEVADAGLLADLVRREQNGGKGAAVLDGLARARDLGFTHAFQIDADGQHDLGRIPAFVAAAEADPDALVLGAPVYDDAASPASRRRMRELTNFWVRVETGGRARIDDAMIGFRIYPIEPALAVRPRTRRMDFDIEILVLMVQAGVPTVNLPVEVRYLTADEGGVSHFDMLRDNVRLSWLHSRLCTLASMRFVFGLFTGRSFRRGRRGRGAPRAAEPTP